MISILKTCLSCIYACFLASRSMFGWNWKTCAAWISDSRVAISTARSLSWCKYCFSCSAWRPCSWVTCCCLNDLQKEIMHIKTKNMTARLLLLTIPVYQKIYQTDQCFLIVCFDGSASILGCPVEEMI